MRKKKQQNPRQQLAQKIVTAKKGNTRRGGRKPMPKGLALGRQGRRKIGGQSNKGWSKVVSQFTPEQVAIINEYEAAGKPIGTVEKGISMIPSGGTSTVMPQIRPPNVMPQIRPPKRRKMRRY